MCVRLYLNGHGMGNGTHISLFFVMMKGEYDACLSWPFRQKVTLALLDQESDQHLVDFFRPDPDLSSFRRPIYNMNIAYGCPNFASQETVLNGPYLRDDTIVLVMSVDTTDLLSS